jgi:hypothetical protein
MRGCQGRDEGEENSCGDILGSWGLELVLDEWVIIHQRMQISRHALSPYSRTASGRIEVKAMDMYER